LSKLRFLCIAILLQRPVYCFWRADFHGQGATLVTPDNLMYSLPTILPPLYWNIRATITKPQGDIFYIKIIFSGCVIGTPVNFGGMAGRALAVILKLNF
jgi:hypothetical protein